MGAAAPSNVPRVHCHPNEAVAAAKAREARRTATGARRWAPTARARRRSRHRGGDRARRRAADMDRDGVGVASGRSSMYPRNASEADDRGRRRRAISRRSRDLEVVAVLGASARTTATRNSRKARSPQARHVEAWRADRWSQDASAPAPTGAREAGGERPARSAHADRPTDVAPTTTAATTAAIERRRVPKARCADEPSGSERRYTPRAAAAAASRARPSRPARGARRPVMGAMMAAHEPRLHHPGARTLARTD